MGMEYQGKWGELLDFLKKKYIGRFVAYELPLGRHVYQIKDIFYNEEEEDVVWIILGRDPIENSDEAALDSADLVRAFRNYYGLEAWWDHQIQESIKPLIRQILLEETSLNFSDALRADTILSFLEEVKEDPEFQSEEPEENDLLDPHDGYQYQTYVQNNLQEGEIIYYEGWSDYCWEALYSKPEYKGLKKLDAIKKLINERFSVIASECGFRIKSHDIWFAESWDYDNYIMKIVLEKN